MPLTLQDGVGIAPSSIFLDEGKFLGALAVLAYQPVGQVSDFISRD
jgi:hypothetical protein